MDIDAFNWRSLTSSASSSFTLVLSVSAALGSSRDVARWSYMKAPATCRCFIFWKRALKVFKEMKFRENLDILSIIAEACCSL